MTEMRIRWARMHQVRNCSHMGLRHKNGLLRPAKSRISDNGEEQRRMTQIDLEEHCFEVRGTYLSLYLFANYFMIIWQKHDTIRRNSQLDLVASWLLSTACVYVRIQSLFSSCSSLPVLEFLVVRKTFHISTDYLAQSYATAAIHRHGAAACHCDCHHNAA